MIFRLWSYPSVFTYWEYMLAAGLFSQFSDTIGVSNGSFCFLSPARLSGLCARLIQAHRAIRFNFQIDFLRITRWNVPVFLYISAQCHVSLPQIVITALVIDHERSAGGITHRFGGAFFLSTGRQAVTVKSVTGNSPFNSPLSGYSQNSGHARLIGTPA